MKDMNKQIVNCFATNCHKWLSLSSNRNKFSSINIIARHLSQTSNQRTITLNNSRPENEQKVLDKTKANLKVTFVRQDGARLPALAKEGDSLLDVVLNNDIDLDGFGACEGTLACSTCHLIFTKADYDRINPKPTDEELDMLDLAYDLTDTSRLGCQVILNKELDGLEVRVPATFNDVRTS